MPTQRLPTGIDLYYESHGRGEPLVLVPGTGFAADVWLPYQVPELAESLNVIIFDPRGCGRSTQYEGVYTIDQMGCDVVALLDHLDVRAAHLVGHSMGGRIALSAALNFPGRVRSLVLAASGSGPAARPGDECVPGVPYSYLSQLPQMSFEQHIRHSIVDSNNYFTAEFRAREPRRVQDFFDTAWRNHAPWPSYLRQTIARHNWEATHRLGDVTVPTLVLVGDMDYIGMNHVAQANVLKERIPNAEYTAMPGQSHGFFWQAPAETNALLLDWVSRHADRPD
jgi:pimeloyl-ACP methyl ester carboxylesterase